MGVMNHVNNDEKSEQDGWFKKFTKPRLMIASFLSLLKHIRYISMDLDWVDGPDLPKVFNVTEFWEQRCLCPDECFLRNCSTILE